MTTSHSSRLAFICVAILFLGIASTQAQSVGSSTSISGTVTDPTGAVVPQATVEIHNPVSGYDRSLTTDALGKFAFSNVPFNPYHMKVTATGFSQAVQDVEVRS